MLLTQPPECRSRFTNLVQNFFFTHKIVVHTLLHTFPLHQVCLAVTGHGVLILNLSSCHPLVAQNCETLLPGVGWALVDVHRIPALLLGLRTFH
ncbi:hypothetical protein IFU25_00395 [Pantoea agglomerans]|uniref:hypothetical protein n=1 Tax=Enterobacter agglomerans TaxID=549 RepID=UPI0017817D0A|nr:hypothetical protein [Pantoea agglomerans]MBD8180152.1 hypothetical protein [Pantoea agglomerans]